MGSCYSIHLIHTNYNKNCFICWEETSEIYVKCRICKIILHENCGLKYNFKEKNAQCPHCQRKNALYLYKYDNCNLLK